MRYRVVEASEVYFDAQPGGKPHPYLRQGTIKVWPANLEDSGPMLEFDTNFLYPVLHKLFPNGVESGSQLIGVEFDLTIAPVAS